ncbi:MAG TPA: AAA family ATPase, partial [Thermoplasmata archaeon]|nr:AAA family ATPase [Thermoplasmata archaeon]
MEEPALVDRQTEVARLRTALEDLHSRKGALLLLRGETGIGKSRLVEEAFRVAGERGYAAARGTSLTETMSVYFPWHEALRPLGLEHLLEETAAPSLLGLYLVTQAGLLVLKEERVSTTADAEIFSGMVTAVTEFMADALTKVGSTEGPVAAMRSGSRGIVMRRGSGFGLAAVVEGRESEGLLDDLRSLVERIDESCGARLRSWNGSCTGMESTSDLIRDLVSSPKYAGSGPAAAEDPESRRALLFGNVVLGVQRLAELQPVLLVFEDLQWSDPSSLALLHYLARNTRRSAVLLLCNYRIEESGVRPHLAESLGKMRVEGLVDELTIP